MCHQSSLIELFQNTFLFLIQTEKAVTVNGTEAFTRAESDLRSQNNRNPLSKALLLMNLAAHGAASKDQVGSQQQAQLLQVSASS